MITLLVVLVVALAARILFCAAVVGFEAPLRGDEADYHALAVSLHRGEGLAFPGGAPTAKRPPLYPLLLSGIYSVFGPDFRAGRVLQITLGLGVVLLTYTLCRRLFSPAAALLAAAAAAVNPFLIFISGYLLTENLYICLVLAGLIPVIDRLGSTKSALAWPAAAGLALGLASLARPTAFPLALLIALILLVLPGMRFRGRLAGAAAFLAALLLPILIWGVRNQLAMGEFITSTTHGGHTFYQGNNEVAWSEPSYRGGVALTHSLPGRERLEEAGEIESNRLAWEMGMEFVRENPGAFAELAWHKFARMWRFRSDVGVSGVGSGWWWDKSRFLGALASNLDAGLVYSVVTIPLFLFGVVVTAGRFRVLSPLYAVVMVQTMVAVVFFGSLRLRIPVEPVMAIFAAAGLIRLKDLLIGRLSRRPSARGPRGTPSG